MNLFKEIQCDSGTKPMSVYLCEAKCVEAAYPTRCIGGASCGQEDSAFIV